MKTYEDRPFKDVCELELKAREICGNLFERGWDDYGIVERVLAKAFLADWSSERTAQEWVNLAEILENVTLSEVDYAQDPLMALDDRLKKAFKRMVREGYLYSRTSRGKRYYGLSLQSNSEAVA
jgi:hypothetical protein